MKPSDRYHADLASGLIQADSAQEKVLGELDRIYHAINKRNQLPWYRFRRKSEEIQGLYLWGSVGRGKTYLMDLLFESLLEARRYRAHFHAFLFAVHAALKKYQGEPDPLKRIASDFAKQADILCFDEFFVNDIGDAMILGGLLQALFEEGVILVATSNTAPEFLYPNGLQRQRFLPAIELICSKTFVYEIGSGVDYRLRDLQAAGLYFYPLNESSHQALVAHFMRVTHHGIYKQNPITLLGRQVEVIAYGMGVVWFDFSVLCATPRSQHDYLSLASDYHTLLLSGVPIFKTANETALLYFINLIDILYDNHVKLMISASVPLDQLFPSDDGTSAFHRTHSRLIEMQTTAYLSLPHQRF